MRVLITPPGAFDEVDGFDYEPRQTEVGGMGIAHVDHGDVVAQALVDWLR